MENDKLKSIIGYWQSDEGRSHIDAYFAKEKIKQKIFESRKLKVWKYYKSLSRSDRKSLIDKFLLWESSYEEYWYMERHTQTSSNLWGIFSDLIRDNGKDVFKKYSDEDFLGSAYSYKKYVLKTYCGQGCFDRLYYKNEIIFQST